MRRVRSEATNSIRRGDGVGGLGRRLRRHVRRTGFSRKLSRAVWFVCSAESLGLKLWEVVSIF